MATNTFDRGPAAEISAGNRNLSTVDYPANSSAVLAVTAIGPTGAKAPFASYGSDVDFAMPGTDVLGAHPRAPSGLARWSGTSFSTALATGAFAVMRGRDPVGTADGLFGRLLDTATSVDALNPAYAGKLGRGRVDLGAATAP